MNTESVDAYLKDGCGRCDKYKTPDCKVLLWTPLLRELRTLVLDAGLAETMKWGSPCYTLDGKNVVMISSLREFCAINFFRGAELDDAAGVLVSPGPNSHHARYFPFRTKADVAKHKATAVRMLEAAIALERSGKAKIETPVAAVPEELVAAMAKSGKLKQAFDALTPGRQRSHVLHISSAKAADTRMRRVEKCAEIILAGRGFNERA